MAAIIALGLPYGGILGRVYADQLQDVPPEPLRALRTAGASPVRLLFYGYLPMALPDLLGYTFYRFECAVRAAAIMSFVGIQGLGYQIHLSLHDLLFDQVVDAAVADGRHHRGRRPLEQPGAPEFGVVIPGRGSGAGLPPTSSAPNLREGVAVRVPGAGWPRLGGSFCWMGTAASPACSPSRPGATPGASWRSCWGRTLPAPRLSSNRDDGWRPGSWPTTPWR